MNRVAIGIPTRGDVVTNTAICLALLAGHEVARGQSLSILSPQGSIVCVLRDEIVSRAFEQEATHILWVDSDMIFPRDGLERLQAHNQPIVGTNYPTGSSPVFPTASHYGGSPVYERDQTGLEEVAGIGFGFCLVHMDVFRAMPRPWFSVRWDGERYLGEDSNFCATSGHPILIDHDLSREIGHVGYHRFTHADTTEAVRG